MADKVPLPSNYSDYQYDDCSCSFFIRARSSLISNTKSILTTQIRSVLKLLTYQNSQSGGQAQELLPQLDQVLDYIHLFSISGHIQQGQLLPPTNVDLCHNTCRQNGISKNLDLVILKSKESYQSWIYSGLLSCKHFYGVLVLPLENFHLILQQEPVSHILIPKLFYRKTCREEIK